jgi:hypothetical protein
MDIISKIFPSGPNIYAQEMRFEASLNSKRNETLDLLEKHLIEPTNPEPTSLKISVGAASLIGPRKTNEDAHTIILNLPQEPETSFFAVYDGHGAKHASYYCSQKLHKFATKHKSFKTNKKKALTKAFVEVSINNVKYTSYN